VNVNNLGVQEFYTVAKLHAEARHRAMPSSAIVDIRVFNYFSRTLDVEARFFMTDVIRAARDKTAFRTNAPTMTRDFLHPQDFFGLIAAILESPPRNGPVDAFSQAPVDKFALLDRFKSEFGLRYEVTPASDMIVNATGAKPQYFSENCAAANWFGYRPTWSSLDGVLAETRAILERLSQEK
jgi:nucleoside-diphosphate-sugar epimerase